MSCSLDNLSLIPETHGGGAELTLNVSVCSHLYVCCGMYSHIINTFTNKDIEKYNVSCHICFLRALCIQTAKNTVVCCKEFFFTENEILVSLMFVYFEYHRCPAEHYVTMEMFYIILCNTQPLNLCG